MPALSELADAIDALLPQTQCTKCGYPRCRSYAEAIAAGDAAFNQCPPGGAAGIVKLGVLLGRPPMPLNPANGAEKPLQVAWIDESLCIGCTLCIQACPVDAIVGAAKLMHTVIPQLCTGCDLCLPPCPMDCIAMIPVHPPRNWTTADADAARTRFHARAERLAREEIDNDERLATRTVADLAAVTARDDPAQQQVSQKQAIIAAAIQRARAARAARDSETRGEVQRLAPVTRRRVPTAPVEPVTASQVPDSSPSCVPGQLPAGDAR
jgi:Na+-translocating ferredoxin:NAD+ oxidoreductase subunit B